MHKSFTQNYYPSPKDIKRWMSLEKNTSKCGYGVTVHNHDNYSDKIIVIDSPFKTCFDVAKQRAEFSANNIKNSFGGEVAIQCRIDTVTKMPEYSVFHNGRQIFSYQVTIKKRHYC